MEILTYKSKKGNDTTVVYGDTIKYKKELKKAGAEYRGTLEYPGKAKGDELKRLTKSSWYVPDDKLKDVTKVVKAHPIKKKGASSSSASSVEEKSTDKKKADKKKKKAASSSSASSESEEEEHAIADYSEKAYALFGDFDKWADELKSLKGIKNSGLKHPETGKKAAGWIFAKAGKTMDTILEIFPKKLKVRVLKTIPHAFSLGNIDSAKVFDLLNYLRDADLLAQAREGGSLDEVFLAGLKLLAKEKAVDPRLGDIFLNEAFDKYYLMSDSDIVQVFIDQEIPYLHGLGKVTASLLAYAASLEDEEETLKIVKLVKEIEPRFNI